MDVLLSSFPFLELNDRELHNELSSHVCLRKVNLVNKDLADAISGVLNVDVVDEIGFKYYTVNQLNTRTNRYKKYVSLKVFHVNIRSLNANHAKLIELITCCF